MSFARQSRLALADERFLIVRTLISGCAPGLRTTSPAAGWHRLVSAGQGIIIVRTPVGQWSAPARSAVWVPEGVKAELETAVQTTLRVFYIRHSRGRWASGGWPEHSRAIAVGSLLREVLERITTIGHLDRRVACQVALAQLLLHEIRAGAREPNELVWPRDPRAVRVASIVQADPSDGRRLGELCRGRGVGVRTVQRLFPRETGLTFENWRARVRHLHASRLLSEGRKVSEVAEACGYRSASAFVAAFKRTAGVTPGQFGAGVA